MLGVAISIKGRPDFSRVTPAMEAGIANHIWTLSELIA
jgi:hypothetical protein